MCSSRRLELCVRVCVCACVFVCAYTIYYFQRERVGREGERNKKGEIEGDRDRGQRERERVRDRERERERERERSARGRYILVVPHSDQKPRNYLRTAATYRAIVLYKVSIEILDHGCAIHCLVQLGRLTSTFKPLNSA